MPHTGPVRSLTAAQQDEIRRLRAQGLGWKRISDATGIPASTVARYARRDPDPDPRDAWDLDEQPYGPAEHGLAKQALGLEQVTDTCVLAASNDPFYCGTPAQVRDAQWFGQLWRDLGMPDGTHLRRVHYKADAMGALKPDGTPYANNEHDWKDLMNASAFARILGLVEVEAVADKRSRGVSANVWARRTPDETPGVKLPDDDEDGWDGWRVPQAYLPYPGALVMPQVSVTGYEYEVADQPVLIEVWSEKSTMDDILVPLCIRLGVNLASEAKGYESITYIVQLLRRAERYPAGRAVVLYISDNDHAGGNMPVAVARHCQFWAARLGIGAEVLVQPIVLTDEQVERYGLPQAPDSRDRMRTELDALEALHPGELARIVKAEVARWRDPELPPAAVAALGEASSAWEEETGELSGELAAIRAEAEAIIAEYRPKIEELNRRLADGPGQRLADLKRRVAEAAEAAEGDWELPDRPEPDDPEVPEGILYDSSRHWLEQLQAYRAHKGQPPLDLPAWDG